MLIISQYNNTCISIKLEGRKEIEGGCVNIASGYSQEVFFVVICRELQDKSHKKKTRNSNIQNVVANLRKYPQ